MYTDQLLSSMPYIGLSFSSTKLSMVMLRSRSMPERNVVMLRHGMPRARHTYKEKGETDVGELYSDLSRANIR